MRIAKVFNNSVVLGVDERGTEFVLLGRGIGFQAAPGDLVDPVAVEKRFVPGGTTSVERLAAYLDEIPQTDLELTEEIVAAARESLGAHVAEHVLFPLADHISFALRRASIGASIEYPLQWEVASLYPAEVAFSRKALGIIERRRGVRLPDLEAVPLALHFVNAQFGSGDISATVRVTEVLSAALSLAGDELGLELEAGSVEVARFVTHLRYLLMRRLGGGVAGGGAGGGVGGGGTADAGSVEAGAAGAGLGGAGLGDAGLVDAGLRDAVRTAKPQEYAAAGRMAHGIVTQFGGRMSEDEIVYLALHMSRLTAAAAARAGGAGSTGGAGGAGE